jgi:anthranilate phosphoribosyltransferase
MTANSTNVPHGTQISTVLTHLCTQGTYEDFVKFVELTSDKEFKYLAEIAQTLLSMCNRITLPFEAMDVCGTGGDSSNIKTTNISTISAFVLASMGIPVAKHGGRAVSSSSGSVDFLQALGIPEIDPIKSITQHNLCFLPAQNYQPSFKHIAPFRKQYSKRTIFNLLGPLINPATISHQMVGVSFTNANMEVYAKVLYQLGRKSVAVVQSGGVFDELLSFKSNVIVRIIDGTPYREELNLDPFCFEDLAFHDTNNPIFGKTPQENAENAIRFFENPQSGVLQNTIALNCAVATMVFGKITNLAHGIELAKSVIASRKPLNLLHTMQGHKVV